MTTNNVRIGALTGRYVIYASNEQTRGQDHTASKSGHRVVATSKPRGISDARSGRITAALGVRKKICRWFRFQRFKMHQETFLGRIFVIGHNRAPAMALPLDARRLTAAPSESPDQANPAVPVCGTTAYHLSRRALPHSAWLHRVDSPPTTAALSTTHKPISAHAEKRNTCG